MADVTMRIKVDATDAKANIGKIDQELTKAARTAGGIGGAIAGGLGAAGAAVGRAAAGARGGAGAGARGLVGAFGDNALPPTLAAQNALSNSQVAGFSVRGILAAKDSDGFAKFRAGLNAAQQTGQIVGDLAAQGVDLSKDEISGLFEQFNQRETRRREALASGSEFDKAVTSEALKSQPADLRAAGEILRVANETVQALSKAADALLGINDKLGGGGIE